MMMRTSTITLIALPALLGVALFNVTYAVQSLEQDRFRIEHQMGIDREQIHVLNAEWSYLTQPVHLGDMASRHLTLQPLTSAQLGAFDTLPLKGDDPATAKADKDVPIADVLKAMQVASTPVPPASANPRSKSIE